MSCRIIGKICDAWSEVAGCGLVRCKFMEKKDGGEIIPFEERYDEKRMYFRDSRKKWEKGSVRDG